MNMQFFERILNYLVKNFTFWFVLVVLETVDNIFVLKPYRTSTRDHWSGVDRGQNCAGAGYLKKNDLPGPGLTGILKFRRGRDWLNLAGSGIFEINLLLKYLPRTLHKHIFHSRW